MGWRPLPTGESAHQWSQAQAISLAKSNRVPFPVQDIIPMSLKEVLDTHCTCHGISMEMLLASLIPATACALGPKTCIPETNFGDERLSRTSVFSLAAGGPGSGKSTAFRLAVRKPVAAMEAEQEKEFMLKDFTKQGMLRQQCDAEGTGIIASDEVFGPFHQCLLRSEAGVASTGERALLCSFWSGEGHSSCYGTKETKKVEASALCICGFTQPDRMYQLLQTLGSTNDGLLDRFLIWACTRKVCYEEEEEKAYHHLQEQGGGVDFVNVLRLTASLHDRPVKYSFTPEGYTLLRSLRNEVRRRQIEPHAEQKAEVPAAAMTLFHSRYLDHVVRVAVNLHVLFHCMRADIKGERPSEISRIIRVDMLKRSKALVDYLTIQKVFLLEGALGVTVKEGQHDSTADTQKDVQFLDLASKLLTKAGPGFTYRDAKRMLPGKTFEVEGLLLRMQKEGFGTIVEKGRSKVFFKARRMTDGQLKELRISRQKYEGMHRQPGVLSMTQLQANPYDDEPKLRAKRTLEEDELRSQKKQATQSMPTFSGSKDAVPRGRDDVATQSMPTFSGSKDAVARARDDVMSFAQQGKTSRISPEPETCHSKSSFVQDSDTTGDHMMTSRTSPEPGTSHFRSSFGQESENPGDHMPAIEGHGIVDALPSKQASDLQHDGTSYVVLRKNRTPPPLKTLASNALGSDWNIGGSTPTTAHCDESSESSTDDFGDSLL